MLFSQSFRFSENHYPARKKIDMSAIQKSKKKGFVIAAWPDIKWLMTINWLPTCGESVTAWSNICTKVLRIFFFLVEPRQSSNASMYSCFHACLFCSLICAFIPGWMEGIGICALNSKNPSPPPCLQRTQIQRQIPTLELCLQNRKKARAILKRGLLLCRVLRPLLLASIAAKAELLLL